MNREILVLSARDRDSLVLQAGALLRDLREKAPGDEALSDICYTLQIGRDPMEYRIAFPVSSAAEAAGMLEAFCSGDAAQAATGEGAPAAEPADVTGLDAAGIAKKWAENGNIDWRGLYAGETKQRHAVSLPVHAFEKTYTAVIPKRRDEGETLLYEETWQPAEMPAAAARKTGGAVVCIVPADKENILGEAFAEAGGKLIPAAPEGGFDGYAGTFSRIRAEYSAVAGVVALFDPSAGETMFEEAAGLLRGLARSGLGAEQVLLVSCFDSVQERCAGESLAALPRAVSLILPDMTVRALCIQGETEEHRCRIIAEELFCGDTENVLYENGIRKHAVLAERTLDVQAGTALRDKGVYLITGGMGGIGRHIAAWLLRSRKATVVLLGRRAPEAVAEKLRALETLGGTVRYFAADVCDTASLEQALKQAEEACGSIEGIFHAAGLEGKKNILEASREEFLQVLAPKYRGTLNLMKAAAERKCGFLFLCSSSAVMLGDFGNCAYGLGNRFQMLQARYGNGQVRAINWPLWADGGMGQGDGDFTRMYLKSSGQQALAGDHAVRILELFLNSGFRQLLVMTGNRERIERFLAAKPESAREKPAQSTRKEEGAPAVPAVAMPAGATTEDRVLEELKDATFGILQLPKEDMGEDENLADFGYDSILLTEFANVLTERLGFRITPDVFFSHPTLGRLKTYLCENRREELEKRYSRAAEDAPAAETAQAPAPAAAAPAERIAVVGFSGRFPGAENPEELWRVLADGRETVGGVPPLRPGWRTGPRRGTGEDRMGFLTEISRFDSLFFGISPSEAEGMDPQQRIILEETWKALEHAGYGQHLLDEERVGVFVGAEDSDYKRLLSGDEGITSNNTSLLSARIAYQLNLRGPNLTMNTACSSGLTAFHQAMLSLESGECDSAIVAGVSVACTSYAYDAMEASGMLAPDRKCRAFDRRASGMVPAEAAAVLVLKKEGKARRDGHRIYGIVAGTGINYDGRTNGITAPSGDSQKELFLSVYDHYQIRPEEIGLVMAHGTGTRLGDPIELNALADALRQGTEKRNFCCITSTKSNLGHSLAASGLVSMIALLMAMREGKLPPEINCEEPSDYINWEDSPLYLNRELRDWPLNGRGFRLGAVSALGMSGTNAHAVLENDPAPAAAKTVHAAELLVLSAKTPEALEEQCRRLADALEGLQDDDLANTAFTLAEGRMHFRYRCAVAAAGRQEAIRMLRNPEEQIRGQLGKTKKLAAAKRREYEQLQAAARQDADPLRCREALAGLARAFCEGFEPDGRILDPGSVRIPLPQYPFERTVCWVQPRGGKNFGLKNLSDLQKVEYEAELSGNAFYFRDHVILGQPVLPGVGVLELVSRAARQAFEPAEGEVLRLTNIGWLSPVRCPQDGQIRVRISFEVSGGNQASFSVHAPEGESETVYCQGAAEFVPAGEEAAQDPGKLLGKAQREIPGEACYETYSGRGMEYGPSFRYVKKIHVLQDAVLTELEANDGTAADGFMLIPGMADGALQGLAGLSSGTEKARVPFAMDQVEILAPCGMKMWALGRKTGGRAGKYDVLLMDEAGNACVRFTGYTAIEAAGKQEKASVLRCGEVPASLPGTGSDAVPERTDLTIGMTAAGSLDFDPENPTDLFLRVSDLVREMIQARYPKNRHLQAVIPNRGTGRLAGALEGLFRTAAMENPEFFGKIIEMPEESTPEEIRRVLDAEAAEKSQLHVIYRDGQRLKETFVHARMEQGEEIPWQDGAVYLITGGNGGLGRILAREIAGRTYNTVLVLSGRKPQDERTEALIREITETGNRAVYLQLDVTDAEAVRLSIAGITEKYGRLNGIVHCAGVHADRYLVRKSREEFLTVLEPKVCGLMNLDEASKALELDFLICFASITGRIGNAGQADYALANAFMDRYMILRSEKVRSGERKGRSLSIGWPLWKDGGMHVPTDAEKMLRDTYGTVPMPTEEGLKILYGAWRMCREENVSGICCMYGEGVLFDRLEKQLVSGGETDEAPADEPATDAPAAAESAVPVPAAQEQTAGGEDMKELTLRVLKKTVSEVLKVSENRIDPDSPMDEYGLNSITILDLIRELEKIFGNLPKTLFYEFENLREMADSLSEKYPKPKEEKREVPAAAEARPAARPVRPVIPTGKAPPVPRRTLRPETPAPRPAGEEAVAVIGLSGAYPMSDNLEMFWENLKAGRDCIEAIPWERFDAEAWKSRMPDFPTEGGFIRDAEMFDPLFFHISPREAERTDPQERLMLTHAYWALEDAGYTREQLLKAGRTGVIVGAMYSEYQYYGVEEQNRGNMVAYTGTYSSLANRISYVFNLRGPSFAVDTMCSSALSALWLACREIASGSCDMMIVGGVNLSLHPNKFVMLAQGHFAASNGRCMSFGEGGDGYTSAEGVGAAILKPLSKAIEDGDHIYGVIRAAEANHGGKTTGYTVPNPKAQADATLRALQRAGIRAETVNYVEAHGTGTALGDPIEVNSLTSAWRNYTDRTGICWLGSVKSNIGHCEAAAGMAALTKVLLQMKHRQIVPSIHSKKLNPYIRFEETPFIVNQELRPWEPVTAEENGTVQKLPLRAGIESFGAGGSNVHLIVEEYRPETRMYSGPFCLPFSARTEEQLLRLAEEMYDRTVRGEYAEEDLASIAWTLQNGREAMEYRMAVTAGTTGELLEKLSAYLYGTSPADHGIHTGCVREQESERDQLFAEEENAIMNRWIAEGRLEKVLEGFVQGVSVDWQAFWPEEHPQRISLPLYPFARMRCWFETPEKELSYSREEWIEAGELPGFTLSGSRHILWLVNDEEEAQAAEQTSGKNGTVVLCGAWNETLPGGRFRVDAQDADTLTEALGEVLKATGGKPDDIICWMAGGRAATVTFEAAAALYRAVIGNGLEPKSLVLAGRWTNDDERCATDALYGFVQSSRSLLSGTKVRLAGGPRDELPAKRLAEECLRMLNPESPAVRMLTGGSWKTNRLADFRPVRTQSTLRRNGTYLITGGLGGIGLIVADWLLSRYHANVVLTGRGINEAKQKKLDALRQRYGDRVRFAQADVCDPAALRAAVEDAKNAYGALHGVFHGAGVEGVRKLTESDMQTFDRILAAKVTGTRVLMQVLETEKTELVCFFSSTSALLGDFGDCAYSTGNRYMMKLAETMVRPGRAVRTVNWPLWRNGGMGSDDRDAVSMYLRASGLRLLENKEALEALDLICAQDGLQTAVFARAVKQAARPEKANTGREAARQTKPAAAAAPQAASGGTTDARKALMELLKGDVCSLMKIDEEQVGYDVLLADYGFDSISLAEFADLLQKQTGAKVVPDMFFSYPTILKLGDRLLETDRETVTAHLFARSGAEPAAEAAETCPAAVEPAAVQAPATRIVREDAEEPIAVIGISGRFPGAETPEELWQVLRDGKITVGEVPAERPLWHEDGKVRRMGSLDRVYDFDPLFFEIPPSEAETMDPRQRLLLEECWKALEMAGFGPALPDWEETGVFVGAEDSTYAMVTDFAGGVTANHNAMLAARLAYFLDMKGPNMTLNTACSSGLAAVHEACLSIRSGECDTAVAAGVNLLFSPRSYDVMESAGMLSPTQTCRAFDREADGMVPGEGVAAVVLKRLSLAKRDRHRILAVITGSGLNYDGRTNGITAPGIPSQVRLLTHVYERFGVSPEKIGYVMAHGTGTKLGDPMELKALSQAFRKYTDRRRYCAVGSIKSNIGHGLAASGVTSLVAMVEALQNAEIPPQVNFTAGSDAIDWEESPFYITTELRPWEAGENGKRTGAVSSFGMGGTNVHVVLESPPETEEGDEPADRPVLLPVSARSPEVLTKMLQRLADALESGKSRLSDASYTLLEGRRHFRCRSCVTASDREEAVRKLRAAETVTVSRKFLRDSGTEQRMETLERQYAAAKDPTAARAVLDELAARYLEGYTVSGERLWAGTPVRRITLPAYAFDDRPYRTEPAETGSGRTASASQAARATETPAAEASEEPEREKITLSIGMENPPEDAIVLEADGTDGVREKLERILALLAAPGQPPAELRILLPEAEADSYAYISGLLAEAEGKIPGFRGRMIPA